MTSSSATTTHPDYYNTPFTIRLGIRDAASGITGYVYFKGTITGTLSAFKSNLTVKFSAPTQKITLGNYVYTVSLPSSFAPYAPTGGMYKLFAKVSAVHK